MTQKLQKKLEQISLKVHLLVLSKATKGPNKNSHFWACHNCYLQWTSDNNVQVLHFSKASTNLLSFGIWRCLLMSGWHIETHLFSDVGCHFTESIHKVHRCLGRYSPRHNHQPTHQQGTKRASNGQKCQIWAKFGRFGAKNPFFLLEKS